MLEIIFVLAVLLLLCWFKNMYQVCIIKIDFMWWWRYRSAAVRRVVTHLI